MPKTDEENLTECLYWWSTLEGGSCQLWEYRIRWGTVSPIFILPPGQTPLGVVSRA